MAAAEQSLGRKKCGGRGKAWWDKDIEELVHRKKIAYRKWLSSRTLEHKKEYRDLSRIVKEKVEDAKKSTWEEFGKEVEAHFSENPKMFWRKVTGRKDQNRVMLRDTEGKVVQEENEVAEYCGRYFERLLNEGFMESDAMESMFESVEISGDAIGPPT